MKYKQISKISAIFVVILCVFAQISTITKADIIKDGIRYEEVLRESFVSAYGDTAMEAQSLAMEKLKYNKSYRLRSIQTEKSGTRYYCKILIYTVQLIQK